MAWPEVAEAQSAAASALQKAQATVSTCVVAARAARFAATGSESGGSTGIRRLVYGRQASDAMSLQLEGHAAYVEQ
jgi:hypothetical protein